MSTITGVFAITLATYTIISLFKSFIIKNDNYYKKIIPSLAGIIGAALGIVAFYKAPELLPPETDVLTSIVIGIASGLAATGTNQIFKQLKEKAVTADTTDNDKE